MWPIKQKFGLIVISIVLILSVFLFSIYFGSINAVNSLRLRGISYKKGSSYWLRSYENFSMAYFLNKQNVELYIWGEVFNPTYFPVKLQKIEYDFFVNDTYIFSGLLNGGLIPSHRYFEINEKQVIEYSQLNQYQIEAILKIRNVGEGGIIKVHIKGVVYASSILSSVIRKFEMTDWIG